METVFHVNINEGCTVSNSSHETPQHVFVHIWVPKTGFLTNCLPLSPSLRCGPSPSSTASSSSSPSSRSASPSSQKWWAKKTVEIWISGDPNKGRVWKLLRDKVNRIVRFGNCLFRRTVQVRIFEVVNNENTLKLWSLRYSAFSDWMALVPGRDILHLSLLTHRLRLHAHRTVSDACGIETLARGCAISTQIEATIDLGFWSAQHISTHNYIHISNEVVLMP